MSHSSAPTSILIINGSPLGVDGNSGRLVSHLEDLLREKAAVEVLTLAESPSRAECESALEGAEAVIVVSGTYWDSWSSLFQRFLEDMTSSEGSALWMGKPCGIVVSCHAVGGKGILSRLMGVLSTYGMLIPPFSGVVLSLANELACESGDERTVELWRAEDLAVLVHNVLQAARGGKDWKRWAVGDKNFRDVWVEVG